MPKAYRSSYDFIVVGMGAGGATILRTLAQRGFSVIGLEAGGNHDFDPDIVDPLEAGTMEEVHTWDYLYNQETAPNPDLDDRTMNYTTGRMLGGGTSINGMQYVRSDSQYWNQWYNITGGIWTPDNVNAAYIQLERFLGAQYNPAVHGFQGLMQIRQAPTTATAMATKFATALASATGTSVIADYNDPQTPLGTFTRWSLFQTPNRTRASASTNFLAPILDKILLNTTVTKLLFDERNRIVGVRALRNGKEICIKAKKEVIIACGIRSAELLLRSGIGPKQALKRLGIDTVVDNPNVGGVSRNHLINMAVFSANPADAPGTGDDPQALYVGGAFLPNPHGGNPQTRGFQWIGVNPDPTTLLVIFYNLVPESIGNITLQDKDPLRVSSVHENLLSNPEDLQSIIAVYQQQITALNTQLQALDNHYQLISPPLDVISDTDKLTDLIKEEMEHTHHWTGTCRMGGVVDNKGRVLGVKGVRVADISVAPIQPNGNTAGPAIVVGYLIGQLVLQKYPRC